MLQTKRFREAQAAEDEHHRRIWQQLQFGPLAHVRDLEDYKHWMESYNRFILNRFGFGPSFFGDLTLVEVGSGPYGIMECLPARRKIAVDPLMGQFTTFMKPHWNPSVIRLAGMGENLPIADAGADCVFAVNCLDHASDPTRIVAEISRCLKSGGLLFLSNNVKSIVGVWMARLGETFGIRRLKEIHHPHALSRGRIEAMIERGGFRSKDFALVRGRLRSDTKDSSLLNLWKRALIGEQAYYGLSVRL